MGVEDDPGIFPPRRHRIRQADRQEGQGDGAGSNRHAVGPLLGLGSEWVDLRPLDEDSPNHPDAFPAGLGDLHRKGWSRSILGAVDLRVCRPGYGVARGEIVDQDLLRSIVDRLQHYRQAATYGALSGVVGGTPQTVMADEPRLFRNSWIVDQATRRPTGYDPEHIHPELFASIEARGVIETPDRLSEWLSSHMELAPRDDWERRLLAIGTDCGVSLPPSALTSEGMYD